MNKNEEKQILTTSKNVITSLSTISYLCYWLAIISGIVGLFLIVENYNHDDKLFNLGIGCLILTIPLLFKGFILTVNESMLSTNTLIAEKLCESTAK
jgi:hypothetical protein